MKVLSLFDGISCARVAIERAGIPIQSYHACEIDKYAIQVAKKNYPSTVHLGDVREIKEKIDVDLLIGGSPCQDLSIAKKGRKGLEGDRSGLFWEYVRIRELMQPKYFILENVASMPQKDKDIITEAMGVQPVMFNASLVSAQTRKRLFWTNIPFELPEDCGILLKDILQPNAEIDERMVNRDGKAYTLTARYSAAQEKNSVEKKQRTMVKVGHLDVNYNQGACIYSTEGKSCTLSSNGGGIGANTGLYKVGHIGKSEGQANRVYSIEGKSCTLSANGGGSGAKTGLYEVKYTMTAQTGRNETKKLGYVGDKDHQAKRVYDVSGKLPALNAICNSMVKCGRIVGRRLNTEGKRDDNNHELECNQQVEVRDDEKTNCLSTVQKDNVIVDATTIRKLTPIECERLQGLPDNYTEGVSTTQRYKCLGNAFNVDVICHILGEIKY